MIPETALRIAGPGSHLVHVARPTGVLHLYTGPLTPSGRYVPRSGRTVCRAHTRRLRVLLGERPSSLFPRVGRRMCVRCSARLAGLVNTSTRRAEPSNRDQYRDLYADLEPFDVAAALEVATSEAEVDHAAHLSLVLFGQPGCTQPVTTPAGGEWPPLHELVYMNRGRFRDRSASDRRLDDLVATGYAHQIARRAEVFHERQERIRQVGFVNANR